MPKVSVIIPVYGVENYIERCARSLFEQTLDDIEYLFVDDCTPDKSIDVLERLIHDYPSRESQVFIHHMEQNSGQAKVREWGVKNSKGDYIIHCDSDDWVDLDLYRTMYEKAISENADMVMCDFVLHDGLKPMGTYQGGRSIHREQFIIDMLYQEASWSVCNKLVKRNLYNNLMYPVSSMGEDMVISLQTAFNSYNISFVKNVFYFYYTNYHSISRTDSPDALLNRAEQYKTNYETIHEFYKKQSEYKLFRKAFVWTQYSVKSMYYNSDPRCRQIRRQLYPNVEYMVLFDHRVSIKRRLICAINIAKSFIGIY